MFWNPLFGYRVGWVEVIELVGFVLSIMVIILEV